MSSAIPDPTPSILNESKRLEVASDGFVTYDLTRYDSETSTTKEDEGTLSDSQQDSSSSFRVLGLLHIEERCCMTEERKQQQQGQRSWRILQEAAPQTIIADCSCSFSGGKIRDPCHSPTTSASVVADGGTCCLHEENSERQPITVAAFRQELQRARHREEALQKDVELLQAICQQLEQDFYVMVQERDIWKERFIQQEDTMQHLMDHSNRLEEALDWTDSQLSFWSASSSLRTIPLQHPFQEQHSSDSISSSNALVVASIHATQPILSDSSATSIVQHRLPQEEQKIKEEPVTTTTTTTATTVAVAASDSSIIDLESFLNELWPF